MRLKKPDGGETSVSLRNLAKCPGEKVSDRQNDDADVQHSAKETGDDERGQDNEQKDEEEEILQLTLRKSFRIGKRTEKIGYDK